MRELLQVCVGTGQGVGVALQLLLGPFLLGDIADRGGDQHSLFRVQWAEADLHGKLGAILSPPVQLQLRPHWSCPRLCGKALPMAGVRLAKALRHQQVHRLTQQLLAPIAEQLLGLGVDHYDLAAVVDDHHRVRGRLQQPAEHLFARSRRADGFRSMIWLHSLIPRSLISPYHRICLRAGLRLGWVGRARLAAITGP